MIKTLKISDKSFSKYLYISLKMSIFIIKILENMELEELIENTLRRKHLEEMMGRPEKEHTPP